MISATFFPFQPNFSQISSSGVQIFRNASVFISSAMRRDFKNLNCLWTSLAFCSWKDYKSFYSWLFPNCFTLQVSVQRSSSLVIVVPVSLRTFSRTSLPDVAGNPSCPSLRFPSSWVSTTVNFAAKSANFNSSSLFSLLVMLSRRLAASHGQSTGRLNKEAEDVTSGSVSGTSWLI